MKPKTIVVVILLIIIFIILLNNNEPARFWLFGEIYTSKLIILSVFFILGMITGGIVFRRKADKFPKEYSIANPHGNEHQHFADAMDGDDDIPEDDGISDEDREFLRRD